MTKKDFELIARQLYQSLYVADMSDNRKVLKPYIEAMSRDFADALQHTNPLFDRRRFLDACGVDMKCKECEAYSCDHQEVNPETGAIERI